MNLAIEIMEAKDLRLGNLVYHSSGNVIDVDIIHSGIEEDDLKPIPLTKEWLVKLGFVSDDYEFQETYCTDISTDERYDYQTLLHAIYMDDHTNIYVKDVERGNELIFSDVFIKKVKYVHQLQNLFHAITGEEISLKTEC